MYIYYLMHAQVCVSVFVCVCVCECVSVGVCVGGCVCVWFYKVLQALQGFTSFTRFKFIITQLSLGVIIYKTTTITNTFKAIPRSLLNLYYNVPQSQQLINGISSIIYH